MILGSFYLVNLSDVLFVFLVSVCFFCGAHFSAEEWKCARIKVHKNSIMPGENLSFVANTSFIIMNVHTDVCLVL